MLSRDKTTRGLAGYYCYLAGPIAFAKDDGVGWRSEVIRKCHANKVGLSFFDPTSKPPGYGSEVGEEKDKVAQWKKSGQWDNITEYVKNYRRIDLKMVDLSDIMILYVDKNIHMCGSYQEATFAEQQHKPIFAIINGGKKNCPDWLFSMVDHKYMFDSVDKCVEELIDIDRGYRDIDPKFVLINRDLVRFRLYKERE